MEELIRFLGEFNNQTLLAMTAILWYFTRNIRNEIKKEVDEIRKENSIQAKRSDKLYEMFIDLLKEKK
jgi:hypothetical protein